MKILIAFIMTVFSVGAFANYASFDIERVRDNKGVYSTAQYYRVGAVKNDLTYQLQIRTGLYRDGLSNSVEGTVKYKGVFAGIGHDNGFNGGERFRYGIVGYSGGFPAMGSYVYYGGKTRLGGATPKSTSLWVGVSRDLTKHFSVSAGWGLTTGDFKEHGTSLGINYSF